MKILATSDIHGNKALIYTMLQAIRKEKIDVLIIAGDITPKGFYSFSKDGYKYYIESPFSLKNKDYVLKGNENQIKARLDLLGFIEIQKNAFNLQTVISRQKEQLRQICSLLKTSGIPIFMLIGNDDHIPDNDWEGILDCYKINNLNLQSHVLGKLKIVGFQYVLPTPWNTNNELPENELAKKLKMVEDEIDRNTILVTHMPPKGILDRLATGQNVGSESVYKLIINKQPIFHIFGHIHESFGNVMVGKTLCCNVSSFWEDWVLKGYILDTKNRTIKEIRYNLSIDDFENIYKNILERSLSGW